MQNKFKYIRHEMRNYRFGTGSLVFFSLILTFLYIIPAMFMIQVHDRVLHSRNQATLLFLCVIGFSLIFAWALLERLRERALDRISYAFDHQLAPRIFETLNRQTDRLPADVRGLILGDLTTVRSFVAGGIMTSLLDLMWVPLIVLIAFLMHFWIGVTVLGLTAAVALLAVICQLLAREHVRQAARLEGQAAEFGRAVMRSSETARVMGMLPRLGRRWYDLRGEGLGWLDSAARRTAPAAVPLRTLQHATHSIMVVVGAILVLNSEIGIGLMFGATFLALRTLHPVVSVATNWRSIWNVLISAERLELMLAETARRTARVSLPRPDGALVVSRVSASPQNRDVVVISDVSFTVGPGQVVGVVGASGAGKSSLGRVLVGAWRLTRGSVTLAGHEIAHWDQDQLGDHVGYVPQDVEMLPGTVAQNIARFEEPGLDTDQRVIEAVNLANIKDIVARLPHGLNTRLGPDGHQMSSGQRQRVALARAVYGEPSLIVLDEPNSNLDAPGEQNLAATVRALRERGAIVILITHRMNMLSHCDHVLVMNNGTVHAFGERDLVVNRLASFQPPRQLTDRKSAVGEAGGTIAA
jgi:PrtD family type I secretion system ABC transporter